MLWITISAVKIAVVMSIKLNSLRIPSPDRMTMKLLI